MTRKDVINAWRSGNTASIRNRYTKTLHTDGDRLYSYSVVIGYRSASKGLVAIDRTGEFFESVTTSRHCNMAKVVATSILSPEDVNWKEV